MSSQIHDRSGRSMSKVAALAGSTIGRRESQRQNRREAIIAAARSAFFEGGFAAVSMSDIAASIGGSKSTLWSYFPSKDALFSAVIESAAVELHGKLKGILRSELCSSEKLHEFSLRYIETVCSERCIKLHRLIISEAERFPRVGEIFYECAVSVVHDELRAYFLVEMLEGRMRQADPSQAASEFVSLLCRPQHFELWNISALKSGSDREGYACRAIDTFRRAYQKV
ncbi:TetR/AcrR family transcriptional regulator [Novosphingobium terrae]|uniref:TetR/AcrR family transcriptional regulator n=1 Tax=Novosphingobium terrae TaxID=2726189 RepID=UPI00197D4EF2|nr:TetR/AcrR family transcriptional regulator [Novosphingobium terrae]